MTNSPPDARTVLYVSGFSDIVGGGQRSFLLLLKNLDRSRFRPVVLCPAPGEVAREVGKMGIAAIFLDQPKLKTWMVWKIAAYVLSLRGIAADCGARLIHCDTLASALLAGLSAAGTGVAVVFHARVSDSGGLLDRLAPYFSDRIICVSKAVAARFPRSAKVSVIYNSVDTEVFIPVTHVNSGPEKSVIGYCGQLLKEKGLADLIVAFSMARAKFPDAMLMLAGRGPFEDELKDIIVESGLKGAVVFPGFVEDISLFMAALDIFVAPTRFNEGLSRVLIEAMACGKPVVTTPLGGNPETVEEGETGFMVPPGDVTALSEKIILLLRDRELSAKMGASGRARAIDIFDARKATAAIHGLYSELIN